jgi:hypothetical protein
VFLRDFPSRIEMDVALITAMSALPSPLKSPSMKITLGLVSAAEDWVIDKSVRHFSFFLQR